MRIEYWGRIRHRAHSFYVVIPKDEAYKLMKDKGLMDIELAGQEVKVEVTL